MKGKRKMTNYFENCNTQEELKATYKKLVLKFHPDIYGEKGNDILKEIHNQLEKAVKRLDKNFYSEYCDNDKEETAAQRARKKEIAQELVKTCGGLAYQYLFAYYWQNGLRPYNHRNPITKHNFSGWNIWQLELKMLLSGYTKPEWSTFAQFKADKTPLKKGEHGTYITLAIISKSKKDDEKEEEKITVYYKGYTVFNIEQTHAAGANKTKAIETIKAIIKKEEPAKKEKQPEVIQQNLWSDFAVVA